MTRAFELGSEVDAAKFKAVHRDHQKGIYIPGGEDTAVSIRFRPAKDIDEDEWGYSDHWIEVGRSLDYTGQGAAPQDQTWNRFNLGLRNALDRHSPVHVFEVLPVKPRMFRYWGQMVVTKWYENLVPEHGRIQLRFVMEQEAD
jgi:hypothetical protein